MDNADRKDQSELTKVEDLEHVVKVRKYRHCAAGYLKLAKEPNTMQVVADRYLRIAADEGDVKLIDAAPPPVSQELDVTNGDRLRRVAQEIDRLDERDLGGQLAATRSKAPAGEPA